MKKKPIAQQGTRFKYILGNEERSFTWCGLFQICFYRYTLPCTSTQIIDHGSNQSMTSGGGISKTKT